MAYVAIAALRTERANTPIWSSDEPNATRPNRLMRPYVGFTPTTPQNAAGCLTLPPVSEPRAISVIPAATAAAEPPEDPPGLRAGSTGLRVGPYALVSVEDPMANSSMFVLATTTAPCARSLVIAVASYGLTYPDRIRDPQVVGMSSVAMLSLTAIAIPGNDIGSPRPYASATRSAFASDDSWLVATTMLSPSRPNRGSAARTAASLVMSMMFRTTCPRASKDVERE